MKETISILLIIGILSCREVKEFVPPIQGLWCNDLSICAYFDGNNCLIDKAEIANFKSSKTELEIESKTGKIKTYQFEISKDALRIRQDSNKSFRTFIKSEKNNSVAIKELYYSQLSDLSDFNFHMDQNGNYLLEMNHHPKFDSGKYQGVVNAAFVKLLSILVNQMELNISNKLNSSIVSDIEEWGLKISSQKGEAFKLYYNYSAINNKHQNFINIMKFLPYFLNLKKGVFGNELLDIQQFRENEFDRNLKENNR